MEQQKIAEKEGSSRLPVNAALAYATPMVPVYMLHTPALSLIPGMYGKYGAVDLATIGLILIFSRLLDGITDPLIGYLSDKTNTRFGSRKPWIIVGGIISSIGVYFWFRPGPETGAIYFLFSSIAVYFGWTMIEIPHSAWLAELSQNYNERSRLSSYKISGMRLGYIVFWLVPFLPIFASTEITPDVTAFISWVIIGLLAVTVTVCVLKAPVGHKQQSVKRVGFLSMLHSLSKNKPLRFYICIQLMGKIASGMVAGLFFFFIVTYLAIGDKLSHINLALAFVGLVSVPLWGWITMRIGKHQTLTISNIFTILSLIAMGFVEPGPSAFMTMLIIFSLTSLLTTGYDIGLYALMADVADYGELKTGRSETGNYYAILTLLEKAGYGLGGGLALSIVSLFSFNPDGKNDDFAMSGFYLAFLVIPAILYTIAMIAAWLFPIDARRHAIIVKRIRSRSS